MINYHIQYSSQSIPPNYQNIQANSATTDVPYMAYYGNIVIEINHITINMSYHHILKHHSRSMNGKSKTLDTGKLIMIIIIMIIALNSPAPICLNFRKRMYQKAICSSSISLLLPILQMQTCLMKAHLYITSIINIEVMLLIEQERVIYME